MSYNTFVSSAGTCFVEWIVFCKTKQVRWNWVILDMDLYGDWTDKEKLGHTIRRLRLTNNMSLRDLAEKSGISYSFISSIEKGRFSPSRDTIVALGQALSGADLNELLMRAGFAPMTGLVKEENALYEPEVQFILRAKREMTPKAFRTLMRIAEQTKIALEEE